jgi:hypothetical protein
VSRPTAVLLLVAAGCAPAIRQPTPPGEGPRDPAACAAQVQDLARQSEGEPSPARRGAIAQEAMTAALCCDQAAPGTPACDYAQAIALGLRAREHPTTIHEGLARMATLLRRAAAAEPGLDHAGPDRVLSLLLLRAPGWPLGPGDAEEGLAAARRAATLFPDHAPNQLALAEALLASGQTEAGRQAARRAHQLAVEAEAAGEPEAAAWQKEALRLEKRSLAGGQ